MTNLKVEYLVIINTKNSFCNSIASFNNLLKANADISINNNKLKHKELEVDYEVQTDEMETDNQRFFHVKFVCHKIKKMSQFENLLKAVRDILFKATNRQLQTLWDDISFYYANRAYPLIHEIENLMRKLITKFMLTNVGLGWVKSNIPSSVKSSSKGTSDSTNYLYETNFSQLADFLFDNYETISMSELIEKLKKTKDIKELSLEDLKTFIPKSNWERYFSI